MTTTRITQNDLARRCVRDAVRQGIVGCGPEAPLSEVARLMSEHRIHCVIVARLRVDAHGSRLVWGVVSDLDLASAAATGETLTAGQVAATEPLAAAPSDSLADVARMMAEHEAAHLVVVDERDGEPTGVISTLDVARALAEAG